MRISFNVSTRYPSAILTILRRTRARRTQQKRRKRFHLGSRLLCCFLQHGCFLERWFVPLLKCPYSILFMIPTSIRERDVVKPPHIKPCRLRKFARFRMLGDFIVVSHGFFVLLLENILDGSLIYSSIIQ